MAILNQFFAKLWYLITRRRFGDELTEEMAFHRSQVEIELVADGLAPAEAPYAAARRFGNATRLHEESHQTIAFSIEGVLQDIRFSLRQLRKNPAFAVTAVSVLALGIASSVAIFAFVDATLMRKLLFGVQSWDVATLVGVGLILAAASLMASFLPARRAASMNPTDALRAE
jgi:hypothetical protein